MGTQNVKKNKMNKRLSNFSDQLKNEKISRDLKVNIDLVNKIFSNDFDFVVRSFLIFNKTPATIIYLETLVDEARISKDVLKPLMHPPYRLKPEDLSNKYRLKQTILDRALYHVSTEVDNCLTSTIDFFLRGYSVIFIDGADFAFVVNTSEHGLRSIAQPPAEQVIYGPHDSFIEDLKTNIALIRYRLATTDLRIKLRKIGTYTQTEVALMYVDGVTNCELIEEVERRLSKIEVDRILDSHYLVEFLEDNPRSPFPQVLKTERPDRVVGNLLEGRITILVDGSPISIILPIGLNEQLQSAEDYTEPPMVTSFIRLLRWFALVFSLTIPSLYIAIASFHPELIPTQFAVSMTGGRAGTPFILAVEVILMEIAIEVVREATLRMPTKIGSTLSIIGGIIIGQAIVEAGFVGPFTVVLVSLTAVASFTIPAYNVTLTMRLLRFPLLILSGILGLYGLIIGAMLIINHVLSLKSFGMPYLSPFSPGNWGGLKDSLVRLPIQWLLDRPEVLHPENKRRINNSK